MKFNSLKTRVLVTFSISLFVFLFVFGAFIYWLIEGQIEDDVVENMHEQSEKIEEYIDKFGIKDIKSSLPYAIVRDKKIVAKSDDFFIKDISKYLDKNDYIHVLGSDKEAIYTYKTQNYTILIYDKIFEDLNKVFWYMFALETMLFLLLFFLVNNLLNKIINPIKNINKTAKEISIADFKSHIPPIKQNNEISQLIETFNEMIDRLKTEVEKIERFNSDVSHELKSPLTVINAQIELVQKKKRDEEFYQKSISLIKEESEKINAIVNDMLSLTKVNPKVDFTLCDFNAILMDAIENLNPQAGEKNINIELKIFEKAIKNANKSLIRAIFSNILQNAIKYSPENKNIYISLYEDDKIYFIVQDEGIGISDKDIDKITHRFYRADKSRNKSVNGFGLGLSIVKNAVNIHKGELKITSKLKVGTRVEVIIPNIAIENVN